MMTRLASTAALAFCGLFLAAGLAHAKPVSVRMLLKGKKVPEPGFIVRATPSGVYFSRNRSGEPNRLYKFTAITNLDIIEPPEWQKAEDLWGKGDYKKARPLYAQIFKDYRDLISLKNEFAAMSIFRELESMRRAGDYADLAKRAPFIKKENLDEIHHAQIDLYPLWVIYGKLRARKESPSRLGLLLKEFRDADLPASPLSQAAFLSGAVYEAEGNMRDALSDYHRAFTLNFGKDRDLTRLAMEASLRIYANDPDLEENRVRLREAHGLARIYQQSIGGGDVPKEFERFTKPVPAEPEA